VLCCVELCVIILVPDNICLAKFPVMVQIEEQGGGSPTNGLTLRWAGNLECKLLVPISLRVYTHTFS